MPATTGDRLPGDARLVCGRLHGRWSGPGSAFHRGLAAACFATLLLVASGATAQMLTVDATHAVNHVNPFEALGNTVDRIWSASEMHELKQPMLGKILSMGLKPVSYRLNTELHGQAWHWNPNGAWSDAARREGYFVGSATPTPGQPIENSWGYNLPDRGASLVDGGPLTYWKSNPYLAARYTHEPDARLPQWVIVDLGTLRQVDALRIAWANPYATRYVVQYWTGADSSPRFSPDAGVWKAFRNGVVNDGRGGTVTLRLTPIPVDAQYIRILMLASSHTCDNHGAGDIRNCLGYAIYELYAGLQRDDGTFTDFIRHGDRGPPPETGVETSSVDPWHRPGDIAKTGDQAGLDRLFQSGVTQGLPAMVPVAMLYSNPQTAANEVAYLEARKYPISYIEMGEEPDGQWMQPEDYAALYIQFADAIHAVDPTIKLGGPVFEGHNSDIETWPDADGRVSWLGRFVAYLKNHGHLDDLGFVSFEHYPFDCDPGWRALYREAGIIKHVLDVYRADGVPARTPMFVTESNYSAESGKAGVTMFAALWEADYVGSFFENGGKATYYFNSLGMPLQKHPDCGQGGGILGAFNVSMPPGPAGIGSRFRFNGYLSQYFANRMITRQWFAPVNEVQDIYQVHSDASPAQRGLVDAYALEQPDGQWSVMAVNNDRNAPHAVRIVFEHGPDQGSAGFRGKVTMATFGTAQYQWHPGSLGAGGTASPDGPPLTRIVEHADPKTWFVLPKASINVIRGTTRGPDSQ